MGLIFSKFLFGNEKKNIFMVGIDAAGKTTILYQMRQQGTDIHEIGFSHGGESLTQNNLTITTTDIGGVEKSSVSIARSGVQSSDGIIFVIDISDHYRFDIVNSEFTMVMDSEQFQNIPVLIMLNKKDQVQDPSLFPERFVKELNLQQLERQWSIQLCCAIKNEGIQEGLQWILQAIKKSKKQ